MRKQTRYARRQLLGSEMLALLSRRAELDDGIEKLRRVGAADTEARRAVFDAWAATGPRNHEEIREASAALNAAWVKLESARAEFESWNDRLADWTLRNQTRGPGMIATFNAVRLWAARYADFAQAPDPSQTLLRPADIGLGMIGDIEHGKEIGLLGENRRLVHARLVTLQRELDASLPD